MKNKHHLINELKTIFSNELCKELELTRVEAPLFVLSESGLQDELDGRQTSISFKVSCGKQAEIVHSLAKWKRLALKRYEFHVYEGILTDMKAIRTGEILDHIHSYYVDQWDWEKVIQCEDRTMDYLKLVVRQIYTTVLSTISWMKSQALETPWLPHDVVFISSEELLQRYPQLKPKQREDEICREYGAVFVTGIGAKLSNGHFHDERSPDYDDWELNGDLLVYSSVHGQAIELSSMGIRVNESSLINQVTISNTQYRMKQPYHQMILKNQLPYTIGGGIGQSRLCMFLLQKQHIGQVQCSYWEDAIYDEFDDIL